MCKILKGFFFFFFVEFKERLYDGVTVNSGTAGGDSVALGEVDLRR